MLLLEVITGEVLDRSVLARTEYTQVCSQVPRTYGAVSEAVGGAKRVHLPTELCCTDRLDERYNFYLLSKIPNVCACMVRSR